MLLAAATGAQPALFALLEKAWLIAEVVLGIGFMIFIHELGHFLAAKKTGVRVETFSLGFGPKLWGFRKGATLYQICLIPLGGFVKMAGENPDDEITGAPDELPSKTPSQRMLIFSAGVLMNFLFAFVTFPIIFATGVPFVKPDVGAVVPGGPAWKAGILPGDKILEINGNDIYEFHDIPLNIALSKKGEKATIRLERDGGIMDVDVLPLKNKKAGFYQIEISGPVYCTASVEPGGPAEKAGLAAGDRILSINGLPPLDWLEERTDLDPGPVDLVVQRPTPEGGKGKTFSIHVEAVPKTDPKRRLIGIQPRFNRVKGLKGNLAHFEDGLRDGDVIWKIGKREIFTRKDLADALDGEVLVFQVSRREGRPGPDTDTEVKDSTGAWKELTLTYAEKWRPALHEDMAVTYFRSGNAVAVSPGRSLWLMGFRKGVTILAVNGIPTPTYDDIVEAIGEGDKTEFTLTILRAGEGTRETITVPSRPMESQDLGFEFQLKPILLTRKLPPLEACRAGINCAVYQVKNCYLTLSRIISRDVDAKNIGGIITISRATYSFAEMGLARLFFFLAILSINLGFINILPIPVLDGGHLMFLLIEKVKGSPVNEKVMGYSQVVGLVLILALLVYVTYNDILRLFN